MTIPAWNKRGHTVFRGLVAMQSDAAFPSLEIFFEEHKLDTIIEIGTAFGGWAMFLKTQADKMGGHFVTYDIRDIALGYEAFAQAGIDFRKKDCFKFENEVAELITNGGRVALMCDGGNKINEINTFAKHLKSGDFIFAHDYAPSKEFFDANIKGHIWDWCEIWDAPIQDALAAANVEKYRPEFFQACAWYCGRKS